MKITVDVTDFIKKLRELSGLEVVEGQVYCDVHGCIHDAGTFNPYGDGTTCEQVDHHVLYQDQTTS